MKYKWTKSFVSWSVRDVRFKLTLKRHLLGNFAYVPNTLSNHLICR